ncbi:MAG: heparinase II/III family protein [Candidatus Aminicenantaceae bacterium]
MRNTKNLLTQFILPFLLMTYQVNTSFAGEKEKDIPKLQNPVSVSYIKNNLTESKPRMIFNKQIVQDLKGKIKSDPVIGNLYEAIRLHAYEILDQPLIRRVKTSNAMLDISREMLRRVNMLGVVYLVDRDNTILERIDQEVLATCRFSDWNPPVYLDVGEISMAVALALDWTCDQLPKTTIQLAKKTLIEKGIYPSWPEHGGSEQWWVTHPNNWNQVCNGGMIAASIAIVDDDPELAAKTIKRALSGLPHVLAEYMPDGVYPESPMYWEYGTSYSLLAATMLETAFGTDFGHKDYPGFIESATCKIMCSNLPSGGYYNFADCKDKPEVDGDIILAWFATHTSKSMFYEKEKFLRSPKDIRLSYLTGAALAWMSQYREVSTQKRPVTWVGKGKTPIAVFRGETDGSDYYFAAKGGCGAVSHGHMDAGSFIFELNGIRWSIDPGNQSYMIGEQGFDLWSQCQDCERWELLTKNNYGHSTLTVNDERHIVDGYASVSNFEKGKNPRVTFDLTPALEGQVKNAKRTFTKEGDNALLIEDEIETNEKTRYVTWQLITQAEVEIVDEGAILKQDGQKLRLDNLSHPDIQFSIVSLNPPPHELDKHMDNLKRVELRIPVAIRDDYDGSIFIKVQLVGK